MVKLLYLVELMITLAGGITQAQGQPPQGKSTAQLEKIVFDAAKSFSSKYCKDFISIAEYENIVKSKERYCQLFFSYGVFGSFDFSQNKIDNLYNDPNIGSFRVVGSFNSMFHSFGEKGYESQLRNTSPTLIEGMPQFSEYYYQYPIIPPVARKRAVEVYGPLNPRKIKLYTYTLIKGDPFDECEISFTTKDGCFPGETRLWGQGVLFIKAGMIVGYRLDNVEDRFSHFINKKDSSPTTSVNDYSYEVRYTIKDGVIFPDHLIQKVQWIKPKDLSKSVYYFAEKNPCADPFNSLLSVTTKVSFSKPVALDKTQKNRYVSYFRPTGASWRLTLAKPVIDAKVLASLKSIPSWSAIKSDLEKGGLSIDEQNQRQTDLYLSEYQKEQRYIDNIIKQDAETKRIYEELFQ
ncbi:MAG: hypothetical protein IJL58_10655 [Bacteroidales bacterium]|nr:hypothetical protein [Bacteroidales bacterium]